MGKIAYIGPEFSFSHDLVRTTFSKETPFPCEKLGHVVEMVALKQADFGVVPFYNTTRRSIEETQIALLKYRNKVFVTDVIPLKVCHFLGGFGPLASVAEIRSKNVVFHQASKWLKKKLPSVKKDESWESTSLAISSLAGAKPPTIAAIGSRTAFSHYKVPITAKNIQNKPNVTSFFLIGSKKPAAQETDHVLICLPKATERTKTAINQAVNDAGCSVSSNWNLRWNNTEAYFAEVDGTFDKLNLQSCVLAIQEQFKSAFVVGGYRNKCITSLIFAE